MFGLRVSSFLRIALRGGELKTRFLVEVLMGFSDALYRQSHSMWMGALAWSYGSEIRVIF